MNIKEEIIKTTKKLMEYKTIYGNKNEFNKIFNYLKKAFPKNLYIKEYEFDGNKSIVISNTKETNLDIIFCTHIDIVPADDYQIIEDEKYLKGRGSFDMKGSVATCIELFKNINTKKKIALFITSDEEMTGNCAKKLLEIYNSDLAIVPDGGKNYQIIEEEKGQLQLKISIKTKSAHASQPYKGQNAVIELYNIYNKLINKYPLPKSDDDYKTSINLSMINGGEALNSVAENASMYIDIRHTKKDTKEKILAFLNKIAPTAKIEIIHENNLFETDINNINIKKYIEISKRILNQEVEIIKTSATSDAIYFSDKNIPTILTNPVGDYPHSPNEYVEKESLYNLYKIWKEFLEEK